MAEQPTAIIPIHPQPIQPIPPPAAGDLIPYIYDGSPLQMIRLLNRKKAGEVIFGDKCKEIDVYSAPPWTYIGYYAEPDVPASYEHVFRHTRRYLPGSTDVKRSFDGEAGILYWKQYGVRKPVYHPKFDVVLGYVSFFHLCYQVDNMPTHWYMVEVESVEGDRSKSICKIRVETPVLKAARGRVVANKKIESAEGKKAQEMEKLSEEDRNAIEMGTLSVSEFLEVNRHAMEVLTATEYLNSAEKQIANELSKIDGDNRRMYEQRVSVRV